MGLSDDRGSDPVHLGDEILLGDAFPPGPQDRIGLDAGVVVKIGTVIIGDSPVAGIPGQEVDILAGGFVGPVDQIGFNQAPDHLRVVIAVVQHVGLERHPLGKRDMPHRPVNVAQALAGLHGHVPRRQEAVHPHLGIVKGLVRQLPRLGQGQVEARQFPAVHRPPVVGVRCDDLRIIGCGKRWMPAGWQQEQRSKQEQGKANFHHKRRDLPQI